VTLAVLDPLLGREPRTYNIPSLRNQRILITGGSGSIGSEIWEAHRAETGARCWLFDIDTSGESVLKDDDLAHVFEFFKPDAVIHLAADKHAPRGELYPYGVADVNIRGTQNVVDAALAHDVQRLVLASTCKAANPETVYGASKLVAERIVLNAGYTVGRLFNVVESSRNTFEIWEKQLAETGRISVVYAAHRWFITIREATTFLLSCLEREPGRYAPDAGEFTTSMRVMAERWLDQRGVSHDVIDHIQPRRGDRFHEPPHATHETVERLADGSMRIRSHHDA
jgi:FlaA1/EpsC-like NDP-sugar epimerase